MSKSRFLIQDLLTKPTDALELIGRKVIVETSTKFERSVCGYLYTVDPVAGHIVIVNFDNIESSSPVLTSTQILTNHSVKCLLLDETEARSSLVPGLLEKLFTRDSSESLTESELDERKTKVLEMIKANRLPVKEESDGSLTIANIVVMKPPYCKDDLVCSNDIVLGRVKSILFS